MRVIRGFPIQANWNRMEFASQIFKQVNKSSACGGFWQRDQPNMTVSYIIVCIPCMIVIWVEYSAEYQMAKDVE
jgi:hypothetical protein